jgi:hypothetical protein
VITCYLCAENDQTMAALGVGPSDGFMRYVDVPVIPKVGDRIYFDDVQYSVNNIEWRGSSTLHSLSPFIYLLLIRDYRPQPEEVQKQDQSNLTGGTVSEPKEQVTDN